ncbi:outer membrane protein assembly factor BamA, partial [Pelagibacterales bacterium SAG-MED03]|nr:outer membrane protein assembly factor BamA [Pelagibacterales bacterium SAG-MED03]
MSRDITFSFKYFLIATLFNIFYFSVAKSEIVKSIEINGNERIPDETINMFSNVKKNQDLNENEINQILLDLYQTNFFKDVEIMFNNNILSINVIENPLIENVNYNGIKADKTRESIKKNLKLKSRSSF